MTELKTAALWGSDRPAFGGWLTLPSPRVLEELVNARSDYVGIDCQHTMIDENDAAALLRPLVGTETATYIRVTANDPARIGLVLDAGADGVIVPMVNTRDEAVAAVARAATRPAGTKLWTAAQARRWCACADRISGAVFRHDRNSRGCRKRRRDCRDGRGRGRLCWAG